MAKVVALTEEVYDKLQKLKGRRSFSEAVDMLIENKSGDIRKYFGVWRGRSDLDKIEDEITKNRKRAGAGFHKRRAMIGV